MKKIMMDGKMGDGKMMVDKKMDNKKDEGKDEVKQLVVDLHLRRVIIAGTRHGILRFYSVPVFRVANKFPSSDSLKSTKMKDVHCTPCRHVNCM